MIPLPHLSFVQCEQVKFRPKKKVKKKESHSVVVIGTVGKRCVCAEAVKHDINFCNSFNLISLPFLIKPNQL